MIYFYDRGSIVISEPFRSKLHQTVRFAGGGYLIFVGDEEKRRIRGMSGVLFCGQVPRGEKHGSFACPYVG